MPTTMRTVRVASAGAPLEVVEVDTPQPGPGQVRIAVDACGICHTDAGFVFGNFPGLSFPLTPGHEVAGEIAALGDNVDDWSIGDRVAVGWFGGHCGQCVPCREGDLIDCVNLQVPGWAYPGGYAESLVVPTSALARIPDTLSSEDAAPLSCAGVTTFNALRRSAALASDLVAVLGVGGLGHLGIQFATRLGFETVAIARGEDKSALATRLGAHHVIDSSRQDVAASLQRLGGAKVVLATAANSAAMSQALDGLCHRGQLIVLGAVPEPIAVSPFQLITGNKAVRGHASGTARDVEDTLRFAAVFGIKPWTEPVPLDRANEAFARMLSGEARFRMVLTNEPTSPPVTQEGPPS